MFKRISLTLVLLLAMTAVSFGQEWAMDKAHSSVNFTVRHLVISRINGSFTDFDGKIMFDGKNWDKAGAEMTVSMTSVNTNIGDRDKHLRSADFFDVEKFPTMHFKSTKVVKGEGDTFKLTGDLTIKGVTKVVTFDCEFYGVTEFRGAEKAGFSAKTTIDRQEFGITWNSVLDSGGVAVGNEVEITIEVEATRVG